MFFVGCSDYVLLGFFRMAEKYGMVLDLEKPFADYFEDKVTTNDGRGLLGRMQALEVSRSKDIQS